MYAVAEVSSARAAFWKERQVVAMVMECYLAVRRNVHEGGTQRFAGAMRSFPRAFNMELSRHIAQIFHRLRMTNVRDRQVFALHFVRSVIRWIDAFRRAQCKRGAANFIARRVTVSSG